MAANDPGFDGGCVSEQFLFDFSTGRLTDVTLEQRIADHLAVCADCQARFESVSSEPASLLGLLRRSDLLTTERTSGEFSPESLPDGRASDIPLPSTVCLATTQATESLPVRIERYFVIEKLGSGGFAHVYLAKDPDTDRLVAVKVPREDRLTTNDARLAFLREARTAMVLNHPNIVRVYDCRELPDGRCIVVMQYIQGQTLRELLASGRLPPRRVAQILATVARAAHSAHQQKIFHRDIKPANILIDKNGIPHLADFGLALRQSEQLARVGEVAGTYAYIPPEQARGDSLLVDQRADVWGLGVTLYEMATGRRPFNGNTSAELVQQIHDFHPPTLEHELGQSEPAVQLSTICSRCLRKDPAERYASAADLAADLKKVVQTPRRKLLRAAVAIGLVLCGFGVTLAFSSGRRPDPRRQRVWMLSEEIQEIAWRHTGNNEWRAEPTRQKLSLRHEAEQGLLACGAPRGLDFSTQFSLALPLWTGFGGYFWGLERDPDALAVQQQRCRALSVERLDAQSPHLTLRLEEIVLVPWFVDETKWIQKSSHVLASVQVPVPRSAEMAVRLRVVKGELVELVWGDQTLTLPRPSPTKPWSGPTPAFHGFHCLGVLTIRSPTITEE